MSGTHFVNTLGLNLRSAPDASGRQNIVAVLSQNHEVTELQDPNVAPPWVHVSTTISGQSVDGYVNGTFLVPKTQAQTFDIYRKITAIHLTENKPDITRHSTGRAFPIGEANRPTRKPGATTEALRSHHDILDWLDVESNVRYRAGGGFTYCNIYAYDFCYLSGVYLPRVWWTEETLCKLWHGQDSRAVYGSTVSELNANRLFDWLLHFGTDFGWIRIFDPNSLQQEANAGKVAVICAQRKDINYSGHICLVVPELGSHVAKRTNNSVTGPLQSQAGAVNKKYFTDVWWHQAKFRDYAFWVHP